MRADQAEKTAANIVVVELDAGKVVRRRGCVPELDIRSSELSRRASLVGAQENKKMFGEEAHVVGRDPYRTEEDSVMYVMIEALGELTKHVKKLEKQVTDNPNTKKGIKELSHKINRRMEVLNRPSLTECRENLRCRPIEPLMLDADTQKRSED